MQHEDLYLQNPSSLLPKLVQNTSPPHQDDPKKQPSKQTESKQRFMCLNTPTQPKIIKQTPRNSLELHISAVKIDFQWEASLVLFKRWCLENNT